MHRVSHFHQLVTLGSEADAHAASASFECVLHNYMALLAMEERARL